MIVLSDEVTEHIDAAHDVTTTPSGTSSRDRLRGDGRAEQLAPAAPVAGYRWRDGLHRLVDRGQGGRDLDVQGNGHSPLVVRGRAGRMSRLVGTDERAG
ncbi:hypothetical protein [Amycolatopsis balhimycina]|uniref:hypothetical protein n=1 Tax=Amycolatopsis balhimycina TaxID=208443 RepID=UPI000381BC24|nr:hypothetical protein [Amycolatopsis balhimycina]